MLISPWFEKKRATMIPICKENIHAYHLVQKFSVCVLFALLRKRQYRICAINGQDFYSTYLNDYDSLNILQFVLFNRLSNPY